MTEFASNDAVKHESEHSSEKKVELEQVEREVTPSATNGKQSFGQRAKRHCMRWWWVHLIVFCASFLIIALCLVYVAMPKIAQNGVNESWIEFTELDFLNPTEGSITLTQNAILHSPSIFTPTLDPFNASLYLVTNGVLAAEPMMYIPMPSIHALHPQGNVSIENQVIPIANLDRLTEFATAVLAGENVTTALSGNTNLHEGAFPVVNVAYNAQTTYTALNGLAGFNVTNVKVNISAPAGVPNLQGYAYIPNPSVMTIAMGNVTMSLATSKAGIVGNSTILDMTLKPGNNTLKMTGMLNQTLITESLNKTGFVDLIITGQSAVYEGQHLTYYEKALQSNKLKLTMNVFQVLSDSSKP